MEADEAEELARRASAESTLTDRPRCDPGALAVGYLELRLAPMPRARPHLNGDLIVYPREASAQTAAYMIAHECGHHLLHIEGWRLDRDLEEQAASRIGIALMLPRSPFVRDALKTGRDPRALAALWPLATPRICLRRLVELGLSDGAVARPGLRRASLRRP